MDFPRFVLMALVLVTLFLVGCSSGPENKVFSRDDYKGTTQSVFENTAD